MLQNLARLRLQIQHCLLVSKRRSLYDNAIKAARDGNKSKIAQIEATTAYGRSLKNIKDAIETARLAAGAELSADEISNIAKKPTTRALT
jgi:hypothetical protein